VQLVGLPKGKGQAIVFVHGGGGCRAMFATHAKHFGQKYSCVLIDLPGHRSRMDETLSLKSAIYKGAH
jgi:pimeloyl-ACP methyl ester carboxylesterase